MKVRRPSGSKIGRALACPASCWLPEGPEQPAHPSAARGTRIHGALERSYLTAREADIFHGLRPDEVELAKKAVAGRPYALPAFLHWPLVEVECWYNPLTCEATFGSTPDDPPAGWWRGRSDVIGRAQDGTLKVLDHKTGSPRHQTPPAKSAQLHFFAAWLASHPETAAEAKDNGVRLDIYTTQNGSVLPHRATLVASPAEKEKAEKNGEIPDIATQQAAMAALEAKLQVVEAGGPEAERVMAENPPVKNKECFFCPCKSQCPVWRKEQ